MGKQDVPGGGEIYVLVRSSKSGVWGGALPGTVRSLAVVVENRKYVGIPSVRTCPAPVLVRWGLFIRATLMQ